MRSIEEVQGAMISYLKSQSPVTSLLGGTTEIRESEWQGTDFVYPAVRLSIDWMPSVNGCGLYDVL